MDFFKKSIAIFNLMFVDGSWSVPNNKGTVRLKITQAGQESEKNLIQQMAKTD